jgi:hypothetical protein
MTPNQEQNRWNFFSGLLTTLAILCWILILVLSYNPHAVPNWMYALATVLAAGAIHVHLLVKDGFGNRRLKILKYWETGELFILGKMQIGPPWKQYQTEKPKPPEHLEPGEEYHMLLNKNNGEYLWDDERVATILRRHGVETCDKNPSDTIRRLYSK